MWKEESSARPDQLAVYCHPQPREPRCDNFTMGIEKSVRACRGIFVPAGWQRTPVYKLVYRGSLSSAPQLCPSHSLSVFYLSSSSSMVLDRLHSFNRRLSGPTRNSHPSFCRLFFSNDSAVLLTDAEAFLICANRQTKTHLPLLVSQRCLFLRPVSCVVW